MATKSSVLSANGKLKGSAALGAKVIFEDHTLSHGIASPPLLGKLPFARWIPMDVHSVIDYGNGVSVASCALLTDCPRARAASLMLGGSDVVVSALTDYRLSAVKLIPIKTHEVIDHVWGIAAISSPFILGYWKTAPKVALMHVIAGVSNILASLVTDYRGFRKDRPRRA